MREEATSHGLSQICAPLRHRQIQTIEGVSNAKEGATMTYNKTLLIILFLVGGTLMAQERTAKQQVAQEAQVTSLIQKDLKDMSTKEVLMIMVEHAPGGSDPIHR